MQYSRGPEHGSATRQEPLYRDREHGATGRHSSDEKDRNTHRGQPLQQPEQHGGREPFGWHEWHVRHGEAGSIVSADGQPWQKGCQKQWEATADEPRLPAGTHNGGCRNAPTEAKEGHCPVPNGGKEQRPNLYIKMRKERQTLPHLKCIWQWYADRDRCSRVWTGNRYNLQPMPVHGHCRKHLQSGQ